MESLRNKILVMIVGPSAIGKSTIMTAATEIDARFSYVRSFTTRQRRPSDQGTYTYITKGDAEALRASGLTVTYVSSPTTGTIYGTTAESYLTQYSLLDTLANSVEDYRSLPFERTITISLTTDADSWKQWFTERYPAASDEANQRLEEAKLSIEWSLAQDHDHHWLINTPDKPKTVAQHLIDIATSSAPGSNDPAPSQPHEMLALIEKGMWS